MSYSNLWSAVNYLLGPKEASAREKELQERIKQEQTNNEKFFNLYSVTKTEKEQLSKQVDSLDKEKKKLEEQVKQLTEELEKQKMVPKHSCITIGSSSNIISVQEQFHNISYRDIGSLLSLLDLSETSQQHCNNLLNEMLLIRLKNIVNTKPNEELSTQEFVDNYCKEVMDRMKRELQLEEIDQEFITVLHSTTQICLDFIQKLKTHLPDLDIYTLPEKTPFSTDIAQANKSLTVKRVIMPGLKEKSTNQCLIKAVVELSK